jgi:aspartyl-tRNA(Asn)/glutamyl-tRNA(Gln) amidotransferase subunit C
MSDFTLETARKVAHLARLSLSDEELTKYAGQMKNIIAFVEQLAEVNTTGVEPLANVAHIPLFLRPDAANDGGYQDAVLSNAPESVEGYFVVQKIVE